MAIALDGETAIQYLYILPPAQSATPSLLLPNSTVEDCCADFKIIVLANDGVDATQNDFTSFLNVCSPTSSAAIYKLYLNNVFVANISGTTYGTNYPYGFTQKGTSKYIATKIDWYKVLILHGEGIYKVSISTTDALLGNSELFSFEYKLCTYRADRADVTIRFDWWQNGTIGSRTSDLLTIDYLALNWKNQIRVSGYFGFPEASYKKEEVQYQNGAREWVFDEQEPTYKIKTMPIPSHIHNLFMIEIMQSDRCNVSDYNSNNSEVYFNKEIIFDTEYKPQWKPLISKLAMVEFTARQRFNNYKKHRY